MAFDFQMSMSGSVSELQLKKAVGGTTGPLAKHLRKIGRRVTRAAQRQVGFETGKLASSIHYKIEWFNGVPGVWVGTHDEIARLHHEGTRPHVITPQRAQFLRFSARGRIVYAREVHHPGTRPNKFLTDNIYLAKI